MALSANHSSYSRKIHVFRESLCTFSSIFFKNISLCCMVNFPEKMQTTVLEESMFPQSFVPRKMCEFRARGNTLNSIGKHDETSILTGGNHVYHANRQHKTIRGTPWMEFLWVSYQYRQASGVCTGNEDHTLPPAIFNRVNTLFCLHPFPPVVWLTQSNDAAWQWGSLPQQIRNKFLFPSLTTRTERKSIYYANKYFFKYAAVGKSN
jgi:hypothetical protein